MVTDSQRPTWSQLSETTCCWKLRSRFPLAPTARAVCSPKSKLIIELDGSQHLEQEEYDTERTKYLESQGYKVIRFWNNDVMNNIEGVILAIIYALEKHQ
ncbi:MAG TPA: DUF559 domain-containing protein [Anaerolineales bacterium]|nr:DUF559 domain-containing protein [Anaerolineales bacterium]